MPLTFSFYQYFFVFSKGLTINTFIKKKEKNFILFHQIFYSIDRHSNIIKLTIWTDFYRLVHDWLEQLFKFFTFFRLEKCFLGSFKCIYLSYRKSWVDLVLLRLDKQKKWLCIYVEQSNQCKIYIKSYYNHFLILEYKKNKL